MPTIKKQVGGAPKKVVKKGTTVVAKKPKEASVWDMIEDVTLEEGGLKVSIYGRSGTGKTRLMATFPKPMLIIGSERGFKSIHNVTGLQKIVLRSSDQLVDLIAGLREQRPSKFGEPFASVGLDTATMLQDLVLKEILGLDELPEQKSWGMATQQDYGVCSAQVKEYLRHLLDLADNTDMHVAISAQERNFNEGKAGEVLDPSMGPALTPALTSWLNPACDYIVETFIREQYGEITTKVAGKSVTQRKKTGKVEFCIRTAPDPIYTTKFRVGVGCPLPSVIIDPTFDKIMKVIKGDK